MICDSACVSDHYVEGTYIHVGPPRRTLNLSCVDNGSSCIIQTRVAADWIGMAILRLPTYWVAVEGEGWLVGGDEDEGSECVKQCWFSNIDRKYSKNDTDEVHLLRLGGIANFLLSSPAAVHGVMEWRNPHDNSMEQTRRTPYRCTSGRRSESQALFDGCWCAVSVVNGGCSNRFG
jgi:hypothetical protein